ncbi:MAG: IS607 family transposase [Acidimicrobiia bacterium]
MNLSEWAGRVGVSKFTAYRWFREGTLPVPAQRVGRLILVDLDAGERSAERTVLYARVSSHDQRSDLDRQVARLTEWATGRAMSVDEVVTEVGSGMNGKRRRLARLLADPTATCLVVEHRDRLARFGVEHLEAALSAQGRRVVVVDDGEVDDDLVRDVTEVLTSLCARLYGRRGARNRAEKALRCAARDVGPMAMSVPGAGR